jgi:hypothetical protein
MKKLFKYTTSVYVEAADEKAAEKLILQIDPQRDWVEAGSEDLGLSNIQEVKSLDDLAAPQHMMSSYLKEGDDRPRYALYSVEEFLHDKLQQEAMRNYKLYTVKLEYETVVAAESYESAETQAHEAVFEMFKESITYPSDISPSHARAELIRTDGDLPEGWSVHAVPYGKVPEELEHTIIEDYLRLS